MKRPETIRSWFGQEITEDKASGYSILVDLETKLTGQLKDKASWLFIRNKET